MTRSSNQYYGISQHKGIGQRRWQGYKTKGSRTWGCAGSWGWQMHSDRRLWKRMNDTWTETSLTLLAIRMESTQEYAPMGVTQERFKKGVMWCHHHRKAWTTVQAFLTTGWTTRTMTLLMTLTHTWSMARDTGTGRHLKMLLTDSDATTQLTCGVIHTMTHDNSQQCTVTHSHTVGCNIDRT